MRLVGLGYTIPFGLIYLRRGRAVLRSGYAAGHPMSRKLEAADGWHLLSPRWPVSRRSCVYWPDRGWFLYPALIGASWIAARSIAGPRDGTTRQMISAALMVGAIYVIVWNANYLALIASRSRLHDASIRALDEAVYSAILGRPIVVRRAGFLLVHTPWLVTIFERAYLSLFAEIALGSRARDTPDARAALVRGAAGCLLCGRAARVRGMAGRRAVSRCIQHRSAPPMPASTHAESCSPRSKNFLRSASAGSRSPDLGISSDCRACTSRWRSCYNSRFSRVQESAAWVVAPINALIIASTFILGYHYLADVPGGCAARVSRCRAGATTVLALRERITVRRRRLRTLRTSGAGST